MSVGEMDSAQWEEAIMLSIPILRDFLKEDYILVGGASLALLGFRRTTHDIDALVRAESIPYILSRADPRHFAVEDGKLFVIAGPYRVQVDLLTELSTGQSFEDLMPVSETADGTKTPP